MNIISVINRSARAVDRDILTSGSVGIEVNFQFDDTWEGLDKVVSFTNDIDESGYDQNLFGSDTTTIPAEVMTEAHRHVYVGVTGTKITHNDDGSDVVEIVIPTVYADLGVICQGAIANGENSSPITATDKEQITAAANEAITIANSAKNVADEVARKAAEGEFDGRDGYTPVKGVDYFDGKDGADGSDYILTEQDKQDIADMVHVEGGGGDTAALEERIKAVEDDTTLLFIGHNNLLNSKQDKLTEGANITIENNVISATGGGGSYDDGPIKGRIGAVETRVGTAEDRITVIESKEATWDAKSNFSGKYADLTGKPTLFDGDYNKLTNKPVIPNVPNIVVLSQEEYDLLCELGDEDENTIYIIPEEIG